MTDTEVLDTIRKILRSRPRTVRGDAVRGDLAKFDLIVGLVQRQRTNGAPTAAAPDPPAGPPGDADV